MKKIKSIYLSILFSIITFSCYSQCLEYGEFDDPFCGMCTPAGWNYWVGSPQMFDPNLSCLGVGPSPTGQTAAYFLVNSGYSEGFYTTITGLTPGSTYNLGFWYFSEVCGALFCCATLDIYVDGVLFSFSDEPDWTLAEMCVEAMGSSITIEMQGIDGGGPGSIYVDDAFCSELTMECCGNMDKNFDFDLEYCEDYGDIILPTISLEGIPGTWNIPIVNSNTYAGQLVLLIFTPDDPCISPYDTSIRILELVTPSFSFPLEYCRETNSYIPLPSNSDEFIYGTWSEYEIYPEDWSQDIVTVVFTPDELSCAIETTLDIYLLDGEELSFDLPDTLCANQDSFDLPDMSIENIAGLWDITSINPAELSGEINVTFESTFECYKKYTHNFFILDSIKLSFDKLFPICGIAGIIELDSLSDQGHLGSWSIPIIDIDTLNQTTLYNLWTPLDSNNYCLQDTLVAIEFLSILNPIFDFDTSFCQLNMDTIFLDPISINGLNGEWNSSFIIPSEISEDSLEIIFTPNDSLCASEIIKHIFIHQADVLSFDIPNSFCKNQGLYYFPNESIEGVTGIWVEPFIDPSELDGNYTNYFVPDSACYLDYEHQFLVRDFIDISFIDLDSFCTNEGLIILSDISDQGIDGNWLPQEINSDTLSSNSVLAVWNPIDNLNGCISEFTKLLFFENPISSSFDFDLSYCRTSQDTVFFPNTSLEGIIGVWDIPFILPIESSDSIEINFTPSEINCYQISKLVLNIKELENLSFNLIDTFCSNQGIIDLPSSSMEGIGGSWGINPIDLSLYSGLQITSFVADSECTNNYDYAFFVYQDLELTFDVPSSICKTDTTITLNPFSNEGIEGNWTPPSFNPSVINDDKINLIWQATDLNNLCLMDSNITILLTTPVTPDFDFNLDYCSLDDAFDLPITTNDGITGSWSIPNIDPSLYSNELLTIVFMPEQQNNCIDNYETQLNISEALIPEFNLPNHLCWDDNDLVLASTSDNGIAGSWTPGIIDIANNLGIEVTAIFTADDGSCSVDYTWTIQIVNDYQISLNIIPASSCTIDDASIEIIGDTSNLEFSIDEGATWQTQACFKTLAPGSYEIIATSNEFPNCIKYLEGVINALSITQIDEIIINNISSCQIDDGSIEIIAQGQNLEYSIDGGIIWTDSFLFTDLSAGNYEVIVRSQDDPLCSQTEMIVLIAPNTPTIIDIELNDPNNCDPISGSINIQAFGFNDELLEYSIDGGLSWQSNGSFENLSQGNYEIVIRLLDYPDCLIQENVSLSELTAQLSLPSFEVFQLGECEINDGSILFNNNGLDLEFSIDNGVNWQSNTNFFNLSPGAYEVLVRLRIYPNCFNSLDFIIDKWECPCNDLLVDYSTAPSYCVDDQNGSIGITQVTGSVDPNVQISWSDGSNDNMLVGLSTGWYSYSIEYDSGCIYIDSIFLEYIDPLTFGLQSFDESCPNANDGIIEIIEVNGGIGPFSYSIDGEVYQSEDIFYNLSPDEYQIFILDQNNCIKSEFISLFPNPGVGIVLPELVTIELGSSIFLNPLIDQTTIDSFAWSSSEYILNPKELVAEVAPTETSEFTLTVYFDECIEIRKVLVEVVDNSSLYLGTAFSPNGDGNNDIIFIQTKNNKPIEIHSFQIYDRWGNLVFNIKNPEINNQNYGWDGLIENQKALPGVYVYKIESSTNGSEGLFFGQLTLLR